MQALRFVTLAPIVLVLAGGGRADNKAPDEKTGLKVGAKASAFELKDQNGKERTLEEFAACTEQPQYAVTGMFSQLRRQLEAGSHGGMRRRVSVFWGDGPGVSGTRLGMLGSAEQTYERIFR
jgi:hypothetical protein